MPTTITPLGFAFFGGMLIMASIKFQKNHRILSAVLLIIGVHMSIWSYEVNL